MSELATNELLERIRRSGLIPHVELDVFLSSVLFESDELHNSDYLLEQLIHAQLLTPFQADRIRVGKYKGFTLGNYVILDRLGGGGSGQVFLAEHVALHRLVAMKVLPVAGGENTVARERFLREARAASELNHPNICRVLDLGIEGPLLFHVMDYIEGVTLQSLVAHGGPLRPEVVAEYGRQIALGLQYLCDKGLVHRDIKPGNLFVERNGTIKILDFGLVRIGPDSKLTANLGANAILGTADYLAPEQAVSCSQVDIRADLYSVGATLYYLLVGHTLFPEGKAVQKLMWQQWKEPTPIETLRPDLPPALVELVTKFLEKRPENRYQEPWEVAKALGPISDGIAPPPSEFIPKSHTRRHMPWPVVQEPISLDSSGPRPAIASRPDIILPTNPTSTMQASGRLIAFDVGIPKSTDDSSDGSVAVRRGYSKSSIFLPTGEKSQGPTSRIDMSITRRPIAALGEDSGGPVTDVQANVPIATPEVGLGTDEIPAIEPILSDGESVLANPSPLQVQETTPHRRMHALAIIVTVLLVFLSGLAILFLAE